MFFLKDRLQDINNQLILLLSRFENINIRNLTELPNQIARIVIGKNKASLYLTKAIQEVTEADLNNVITIDATAFAGYDNLTSVTIPDSVTTIGRSAFYNCTSLTSVTIGDNVATIGLYAFDSCHNLASVVISNSVTTIEVGAFKNCDGLIDIYVHPITPPTLAEDNYFYTATIHVPIGSGDAYKSATNWSRYADNIVEDIEI